MWSSDWAPLLLGKGSVKGSESYRDPILPGFQTTKHGLLFLGDLMGRLPEMRKSFRVPSRRCTTSLKNAPYAWNDACTKTAARIMTWHCHHRCHPKSGQHRRMYPFCFRSDMAGKTCEISWVWRA